MGYLEQWSTDGRKCSGCQEFKAWDQFSPRLRGKNGRASQCRPCQAARKTRWRNANLERVRAQERAADRRSNRHVRKRYGLEREQLDAMILLQEGRCGICPAPLRKIFVDHDHETGRVRDLLCPSCNNMLGLSGDSPERLRTAAAYIERHKRKAG